MNTLRQTAPHIENISSAAAFLSSAADFILPDTCALCGRRLLFSRFAWKSGHSLCSACFGNASGALFSREYPEIRRCRACGYPLTSETDFCSRCRSKSWSFDSAVSLFLYRGICRKLIRAYKFENRRSLALFFADSIFAEAEERFTGFTIVPVPFRPAAKHKRGWDQIELITEILRIRYGMRTDYSLSRSNGPAQKTMSYQKRFSNLNGKIAIRKGQKPARRILLIDDVFTTGATMNICAKVLKAGGASEVRCIALAIDL